MAVTGSLTPGDKALTAISGFNPRYKHIGLIGYPYFFIFDFLGPFVEVQGYVMLVVGLIFGWLSGTIILAIFT